MHSFSVVTALTFLAAAGSLLGRTQALGINCRGSGLCPLATFQNSQQDSVMQLLRYAVQVSGLDNSTVYNSGDHVTCIAGTTPVTLGGGVNVPIGGLAPSLRGTFSFGGSLHTGGICLFPQSLKQPLTLGAIKDLIDPLIQHGCGTCGSIPVHFHDQGSNDPGDGILTFNYVAQPDCIGNCIDPTKPPLPSSATASGTRRARAVLRAKV